MAQYTREEFSAKIEVATAIHKALDEHFAGKLSDSDKEQISKDIQAFFIERTRQSMQIREMIEKSPLIDFKFKIDPDSKE